MFSLNVRCQNYEKKYSTGNQLFNININKTNNYLSPQITEQNKRPRHMAMKIQIITCERHKNVVVINQIM